MNLTSGISAPPAKVRSPGQSHVPPIAASFAHLGHVGAEAAKNTGGNQIVDDDRMVIDEIDRIWWCFNGDLVEIDGDLMVIQWKLMVT